jgi:hypothetical protein
LGLDFGFRDDLFDLLVAAAQLFGGGSSDFQDVLDVLGLVGLSGGNKYYSSNFPIAPLPLERPIVFHLRVQLHCLLDGGVLQVESRLDVSDQSESLDLLLVFGTLTRPVTPLLDLTCILSLHLSVDAKVSEERIKLASNSVLVCSSRP